MSNVKKAADVINSALPAGSHITETFGERAAQALADAGLIMPDLPAPDFDSSDPAHRALYSEQWEGPVPSVWNESLPIGLMVQVFPDKPEVQMSEDGEPMEPLSLEETRRLAYALLAAANYAEGENDA